MTQESTPAREFIRCHSPSDVLVVETHEDAEIASVAKDACHPHPIMVRATFESESRARVREAYLKAARTMCRGCDEKAMHSDCQSKALLRLAEEA